MPVHLNLFVHECNYESGAFEILLKIRPNWKRNDVNFKVFTEGITNKLIGCYVNEYDIVLIRIYGKKTELLVDRKAEMDNFQLLSNASCAPKLYAIFNNGLAYEYVPGVTLNTSTVKSIEVYPLVASMMAKIHTSIDPLGKSPTLWKTIDKYLSLIPDKYSSTDNSNKFNNLFINGKLELIEAKSELSAIPTEADIVFCHNDLLLGNIIKNENKVLFIDYEYSSFNFRAFDIANHFAEFSGIDNIDHSLYPNVNFRKSWLQCYVEEYNKLTKTNHLDVNKLSDQVDMFVLASHILWACWALVQAEHSLIDFDFIDYAHSRFNQYKKLKCT